MNILTDGELLVNVLSFRPFGENGNETAKRMRLRDIEREHIARVLKTCDGNKSRAARELGISLNTLYNRLHSYQCG